MKAIAAFPKEKKVRLIDHPEPRITAAGQVKVKMKTVGVCGTDREIWNFDYGTPPPNSPYLITGHESLGQIVEISDGVTNLKVGDLVVPTVRRGCPEQCASCRDGKPDFCFTGHFTERGIKERHGYMTEFIVDDARFMNVLPATLSDVGMLLEPLTITEKALMQTYLIQSRLPWECQIEPGTANNAADKTCHNALVLGAGPVGLLAAMAFRVLNMKVYVIARTPAPNPRAAIAEAIGATYLSSDTLSAADIAAKIGNIDLVLEATGAANASFDFLQVLGTNGIFIFTGVPAPHKDLTLDAGTLMRNIVLRNQVVLGTVNAPKQAFENGVRDLAEFVKRWPKELAAMITKRYRPDDIEEILAGRDGVKSVIDF